MKLTRNEVIISFLLFLFILLLTYFNNKGINIFDQGLYAKHAFEISEGNFKLHPSAITNRFGLLLPVAFFIKVFGFSVYTILYFNIICFIGLIIITLKFFGKEKSNKLIIAYALILILNPILLEYASDLLPAIGNTFFSYVAIFLTYFGLKATNPNKKIFIGLISGISLFIAFSFKVSVAYLAPFFFVLFILSIRHQSIKFWGGLVLGSAIPLLLSLLWYHFNTGDWLYRLHVIEGEHNISIHSYYGQPLALIIKRITIDPVLLILSNPGYSIIGLLGFYQITRIKLNIKTKEGFLAIFTLSTLFIYWFGSTSLNTYNPLPMHERMWLVFIPALSVFSVDAIFSLKKDNKISKLYLIIVAPLLIISAYFFKGTPEFKYLVIGAFVYALLLLSKLKIKYYSKYIFPIAIVSVMLLLQVNTAIKTRNITYYYFEEKEIFEKYFSPSEKTLVISDKSISKLYSVYYNFENNDNVKFIWWNSDELAQELKGGYKNIYLLHNKTRLIYTLHKLGEINPDELINQLGENTIIHNSQHLILYKYNNIAI